MNTTVYEILLTKLKIKMNNLRLLIKNNILLKINLIKEILEN